MDTRFWGPSGWRLLHLVASTPTRSKAVKEWFGLLEYVLPCKYCRASFHDYIRKLPLTDDIIADPERFGRWMYDIHNMVNDKLRQQGLLKTPNPSWDSVKHSKAKEFVGWDFFTSIAFTTPGPGTHSIPLPGGKNAKTLAERNRYNRLTCAERLRLLRRWWTLIPAILPVPEWRRAWVRSLDSLKPPVSGGRQAMMKWLWALEEGVCSRLQCETHHDSLPQLETVCAAFESTCGTAKRGKTCRTRKQRLRRFLTRRRRN